MANPVSARSALSPPKVHKQPSIHRRAQSTAASEALQDHTLDTSRLPAPQSLERRLSHNRSASLPSRQATFDESTDSVELRSDSSGEHFAPTPATATLPKPVLPALTTDPKAFSSQFLSPDAVTGDRSSQGSAGWWDVVSAVDHDNRSSLPWRSSPVRPEVGLPAVAESARAQELSSPPDESFNKLDLDFSASPSSPERRSFAISHESPARRAMSRAMSTSASSSPGSESSPRSAAPIYRPPPVPISFNRPSFPSPTMTSPSLPGSAPDRSPPAVKSKLGTFGRSLSIASKSMLARSKEKEREKEAAKEKEKEREALEREEREDKENEKVAAVKRDKDKVNNSPGRWNKDMVANIMGPPVDKR